MSAEPLRILVLADASSIHTEKWVRGLADTGTVELRLVTMNPAGVRAGLRDIPALRRIDEFYAGPVNAGGGNWRYLLNLPRGHPGGAPDEARRDTRDLPLELWPDGCDRQG